jgi:DNA-binding response OmpR family regulator
VDRYLTKPIDTGLLFNEIGSLLEHGSSRKKVMIANGHLSEAHPLKSLLFEKGYDVLEVNESDLADQAKSFLPDIIMIHSDMSAKRDFLETLRFEKGLENVFFVVYQ